MPPTLKSSPQAWEFVQSVTGVGLERKEQVMVEDLPKTPAKTARDDPLDYSRFERALEGEDLEEVDEDKNVVKQTRERGEAMAKNVMSMLENDEEAEPEEVVDMEDAANPDTSEFFDPKRNMAMQGCAHDRSKERALYERPTEEKLRMGKRFRMEGNAAFKEKDYKTARANYKRALIYYDYTFPDSPEDNATLDHDKLACHLNLAAALLNLKEFRDCIAQCNQALRLCKTSSKALFRMAQAYLALDQYDEALTNFNLAHKHADDSAKPEITGYLQKVTDLKAKSQKKGQAVFKRMFEGINSTDNAPERDSTKSSQVEVKTTETIGADSVACTSSAETVDANSIKPNEKTVEPLTEGPLSQDTPAEQCPPEVTPLSKPKKQRAPLVFSLSENEFSSDTRTEQELPPPPAGVSRQKFCKRSMLLGYAAAALGIGTVFAVGTLLKVLLMKKHEELMDYSALTSWSTSVMLTSSAACVGVWWLGLAPMTTT